MKGRKEQETCRQEKQALCLKIRLFSQRRHPSSEKRKARALSESELQSQTSKLALEKSGLKKEDIRYLFGGDLLAQIIATSFGSVDLELPMFGLYGACSTMGEGIGLASMAVAGGFADHAMVTTSSHFASAEKQFRFPLEYGNQRPYSATWTVTGCGSVILSAAKKGKKKETSLAKVTAITTGKIIDMGIRDSMNMGAAMAMAWTRTITIKLSPAIWGRWGSGFFWTS